MQKNYYAIIPANVRYDKDLSPNAKLLYGEITALSNEKGYCWATNEYFADLYKVHNKSISRLISQLDSKGYIKVEMVFEGKQVKERHIHIDKGNDNVTTSPQNCYEGSNKNVTRGSNKNVTDNNTSFNNTNNTPYSDDFESFWKEYPRKIEKGSAYKAFKKAIKRHSVNSIVNGTRKYAQSVQKTEKQFIKHPTTFLNNESFIDGFEEVSEQPKPTQNQSQRSVLAGMWGEED